MSKNQLAGRLSSTLLYRSRCYKQLLAFNTCLFSTQKSAPCAAVCVIANEVLTGKTLDTNSHWISKFMFRRGIDLKRVVVIPDEEEDIVCTVKQLSQMVGPSGYVFTTGGIGPTHDDITYNSVAKAFGLGVKSHEATMMKLEAAMAKRKAKMTPERKRMALLPAGCRTLITKFWTPIAVVENVYILPGIPSMVRSMLTSNEEHFVGVPVFRAIVHTLKVEGDIAKQLTVVQNAHPHIAIGSYVNLAEDKKDKTFNTCLSIEGRDEFRVKEVSDEIARLFDGEVVVPDQ
ncbi:putative MoaB/Mog domain-containing protein [Plasmopara halstedii]